MISDVKQLLRLRTLRVQRARERCAAVQEEVERAAAVVRDRQAEIDRVQRAMDALARALVGRLAPSLPRWAGVADARREQLAERLEREQCTLIDDEHELEQAQERLQQARAELTRALAREDAVRGLADEACRMHAALREQRAEREVEDQPRMTARSPA